MLTEPDFAVWDLYRMFPSWRSFLARIGCVLRRRHRFEPCTHGYRCQCGVFLHVFNVEGWSSEIVSPGLKMIKMRFIRREETDGEE